MMMVGCGSLAIALSGRLRGSLLVAGIGGEALVTGGVVLVGGVALVGVVALGTVLVKFFCEIEGEVFCG